MYCPKCGKVLSEDAQFCQYCGAQIQTAVKSNNTTFYNNTVSTTETESSDLDLGFFCPHCKSRNMKLVSETETTSRTTGGGYSGGKGCLGYLLFGPLGLLCGACGNSTKTITTNNTQRYWLCQKCGNKYRAPEEVKQEAEQARRIIDGCKTMSIVFVVCFVIFLFIDIKVAHFAFWWVEIAAVVDVIACVVLSYQNERKAVELEREYSYIMEHCRTNSASNSGGFWGNTKPASEEGGFWN